MAGMTAELAGADQVVSGPRATAVATPLIRAVAGVEVQVPREAAQACGGCRSGLMDVLDDVAVDEATGCATVTLKCPACSAVDDHTWAVGCGEFEALFGYPCWVHASVLLAECALAGGSPGPVASRPAHARDGGWSS